MPGSTDTALFNSTRSHISPTLSSPATVGNITFDTSSAAAYTIGTTGVNGLTLSNAGTIQLTSSVTQAEVINAPLTFAPANNDTSGSFVNNASSSAATLTFGGTITGGGNNGHSPTLTLDGTNTGLNTISNQIVNGNGAVKLSKVNSGTWVLGGNNTYNGGTTVSAGTLLANGSASFGLGSLTVNNGGVVGGTGTLFGSTSLTAEFKSGATITAGSGATTTSTSGRLTSNGSVANNGGLTLDGGSNYYWKINNASGTAGSSNGWDEIVTSGMSFAGLTSLNPFTIHIVGSPSNLKYGSTPYIIATDPSAKLQINGSTVSNGTYLTTGAGSPTADTTLFSLDTGSFSNSSNPKLNKIAFQLEAIQDGSGQDLAIVMTATPEPGTTVLALAAALPLLAGRRRRRS